MAQNVDVINLHPGEEKHIPEQVREKRDKVSMVTSCYKPIWSPVFIILSARLSVTQKLLNCPVLICLLNIYCH